MRFNQDLNTVLRAATAVVTLGLMAAACSNASPSKDAPTAPASATAEEKVPAAIAPVAADDEPEPSRTEVIRTSDQTLCSEHENILYSCQIDDRTLSVCASSIEPADISYNFGRSARDIELNINTSQDNARVHQGGVVGQGGGQLTHLRFTNGDNQYIVYSGYTGRLASRDRKWSGVAVQRDGRDIANMRCPYTGPYTEISQSHIPDFVPSEPDDTYDAWY